MNYNNFDFRQNAIRALQDEFLRVAMRKATDIFMGMRLNAAAEIPIENLRDTASSIRNHVLDNLPAYLDQFSANATKAGAVIYTERDAQSARDTVLRILRDRGVKNAVKSKSMVTEEIGLNDYLAGHDISAIETDLGEYIVQLAGEPPSHILGPALHKNRKQIGRLFEEKLGVPYTEDVEELIGIARRILRQKFLSAEAGITGANFVIADSGSIVLFTNEGNGRMVTTLPPLHIAVLSIEKILPSFSDLAVFMRLLPRSASGQILSSYVSIITGTRKPGESTGAQELHIVLVDNGRSEILAGEFREILKCIRCSACINVCPVYRTVGGHAYNSAYQGPMGIILTTLLQGMEKAHSLLDATLLCGACAEACPVRVPLPKLLAGLRQERVKKGCTPVAERIAMSNFGRAVGTPTIYQAGQKGLRFFWPLLQGVVSNGSLHRIPAPAKKSFRQRFHDD